MTDEQIISLFGQVPHFINDKIYSLPQELLEFSTEYTTSFYNAYEASLNLVEVSGTQHPDYAGLSWRQFLSLGKRMPQNLRAFRDNPAYYAEIQKRIPNMHFLKIGNQIFVTEDGNHRTCIGKCFLYGRDKPYIHGVHLTEREIDGSLANQVKFIKESIPAECRVSVIREQSGRDDGPGWYRDYFRLSVEVEAPRRAPVRVSWNELSGMSHQELLRRVKPKKMFFF